MGHRKKATTSRKGARKEACMEARDVRRVMSELVTSVAQRARATAQKDAREYTKRQSTEEEAAQKDTREVQKVVSSLVIHAVQRAKTAAQKDVRGVKNVVAGLVTSVVQRANEKTCGIAGCQYKTGDTGNMKHHKATKHGIDEVWFFCDHDNCDYKANRVVNLERHKRTNHGGGEIKK